MLTAKAVASDGIFSSKETAPFLCAAPSDFPFQVTSWSVILPLIGSQFST